jgi:hypothetical protein
MIGWLLDLFSNLLSSPGFWRGAVYIGMAAGIKIDPEQENSIIAGGLAISGAIHAFSASRPKP